MRTDGKAKHPRPLVEIEADMRRAGRRCDNMLILLAVIAAAGGAWLTTPAQRFRIAETWRQTTLDSRLCQAYRAVSPDKTYADFKVCLPPMPGRSVDGH